MTELSKKMPVDLDELESLKSIAIDLGIKYHPSIKIAALKEKIAIKQNDPIDQFNDSIKDVDKFLKTHTETKEQKIVRLRKKAIELKRVIISCLNPVKNNYPGEVFTGSNSYTGDIRRFVPFNTPKGTHVEQILLNIISERTFTQRFESTAVNGTPIVKDKQIPEFAITYLDNLSLKELTALAKRQAETNSLVDDT